MNRKADRATTTITPVKVIANSYVDYSTFFLCVGLYLFPFMRLMLQGTDEGTLVYGAVRIIHGQVFARDFFEVVGPGTFYWLAAFFKLFGVTFLATRICLSITSLGTGLVLYFLSRRICATWRALPCILVAATYFGVLWPAISHHVDSNFFAFSAMACVVLWQDKRNFILLLSAGALAGVTTCVLQPKGILLLFAILAWIAVERWRHSAPLSSMGLVLAGYVCVVGVALFYFWSQGTLRDLVDATFVWPSQNYSTVNAVPYAQGLLGNYWDHWVIAKSGFYWTIPLAAVLIAPLLFIVFLPGLLLVLGTARRRETLSPTLLLYWFCGSALWFSELHRKDIYHLVMGSPVLVILCIHLISRGRGKLATNSLQFLAICAGCLAGFNLCLALTAHPIATRVGSVAMFQPDPALAYLNENVNPGEATFAYPYCPMYYFLSSTNNPTRYSFLMYNYNTPSQYKDAIRMLEQGHTRYVVWNTGFAEGGIRMFSSTAKWEPADRQIMEPYLESHYNTVWSDGNTHVMKRKSGNDAK